MQNELPTAESQVQLPEVKGYWQPVGAVYPNTEPSVFVAVPPDDSYGGAHHYRFNESLGFTGEDYGYESQFTYLRFIHKEFDGKIVPGVQNEQLLLILIDRAKKLNAVFPSDDNQLAIDHLEFALKHFQARIKERIERGVQGKLVK